MLDGHIYYVSKDKEGNVISKDEVDGEMILKLLVAVLDDAMQNPVLQTVFSAIEE